MMMEPHDIHSPFNACMYREGCKSNQAALAEVTSERDELRAMLTAVSDSLDYLHGMTPQQAAALRKDAERYRWLRDMASGSDWEHIGYGSCPETTDARVDQCMVAYRSFDAA